MNVTAPEVGQRATGAGARLIALILFAGAALGCAVLTLRLYKAPHEKTVLLAYHFAILTPAFFWYLRQQGRAGVLSLPRFSSTGSIALVAVLAFICSATLSYRLSPGILITDEQVYRFEARLLESGRLQAAAPPGVAAGREPPAELLFHHNVISPVGWTGIYPIVWPLVLSVGDGVRAAWIVTPLLGALLIFLTATLGRISFGAEAGFIGAVLMFPTPFFLVNTSGMMAHGLAACLVTAALCLLESGLQASSVYRISGALSLFALCFFVRPFTSVATGAAAVFVLLLRCATGMETRADLRWLVRKILVPVVVIAAVSAGLVLLQNKAATGNAFLSPYALSGGTRLPPEVSLDLRAIRGHFSETKNSVMVTILNTAPVFFVLAGLTVVVKWRERRGTCLLMLSALAGSVALYVTDLVPNIYFGGQRMYFEGLPAIAVLAGAGGVWLMTRFCVPVRAVAICGALFAVVLAAEIVNLNRDIRPRLRRTSGFLPHISALQVTNAVVFMRPLAEPGGFEPRNFNPNVPDWQHAKRVFLLDPGADRRAAVATAFRRIRWIVVVYHPASDQFVVESSGETGAA